MERTIISWNIPNWITVVLMAAFGYAVVAMARQAMMQYGPSAAQTSSSGF